jgi:hypothetical protein
MGFPFSWNMRSPPDPLSSRTWQWETASGLISVCSAGKRHVGPFPALANSLGLNSPWVEHARECLGESCLIPSFWKIKGGHMYSYSYTYYAPKMGAYTKSTLESNWRVLKIYVNLYAFYFSKCVVITHLKARLHYGLFFTSRAYIKKLTAHFTPYLEGCSFACTSMSIALQECTVLHARIAAQCERLVLLLLTKVTRERSKCMYAGQQYVSDVRISLPCVMWPIITHELNGLKQVRLRDTADSHMWHH